MPRPNRTALPAKRDPPGDYYKESPRLKVLVLAAEAGKKGNYRKAVKILEELISETDAPPEAWLLLGRSLHALKDYSRSLAAFNDYLRLRPQSGEGYFFAGRTYLTINMPYKAVPFLRKALEYSSGKKSSNENLPPGFESKVKALLGTAYLKSKHSLQAVEMLEEAVESAPLDKRIYRAYLNSLFVRGIRLSGMEDYETSLQMLRFVLANCAEAGMTETPLLRLELGRAARETGKLAEALEHFTRALEITDNDRRIRWSRASILMALGKTAEAVEEIEKIRSQDAGVPELPWNSELVDLFMIRSFLESGEWRRAAESCRNWLKTRDGRPIIHALYAEALRNLRDYRAAHNHLQRALEKEPNEPEFWYADILACWEGKDFASLKKALRAVKSLGGDDDIVRRFTILCQAEASYRGAGRKTETGKSADSGSASGETAAGVKKNITMLQDAVRSLGPEPELMYALGEAYLRAGLLEEAASWFKRTVSLKDGHERSWLGEIAALEALLAQGPPAEKPAGRGPPVKRRGAAAEPPSRGQSAAEELGLWYKAYLEKWPGNAAIRRDRALFLIKTFEYAEAALELEKLLVWEPSNPSLRRVLAYSYRKTGRYREAAMFLKALLREKPRDIGLIIEYSGCLERAGAPTYAKTVLEKARELFTNSADISLALGILFARQKMTEKAFDFLREAAALDSSDPRPYEWMALIAGKHGDSSRLAYYEGEAEKRKRKMKKKVVEEF